MKKLYQVLNQLGYPAGYELFNPHALFKTKKECKEYISYLKSDCGLEDESFTIKQLIRVRITFNSIVMERVYDKISFYLFGGKKLGINIFR